MTVQDPDIFIFNDTEYQTSGIGEQMEIELNMFGLKPVGTCTACWCGYQAVYALSGSQLILDSLDVELYADKDINRPQVGPVVKGVSPSGPNDDEDDWFNNHYKGLNHHLNYTGSMLLTEGLIDGLCAITEFNPPWKFKHAIELVFVDGILQEVIDRSQEMAEDREKEIMAFASKGFPESVSQETKDLVKRLFASLQ